MSDDALMAALKDETRRAIHGMRRRAIVGIALSGLLMVVFLAVGLLIPGGGGHDMPAARALVTAMALTAAVPFVGIIPASFGLRRRFRARVRDMVSNLPPGRREIALLVAASIADDAGGPQTGRRLLEPLLQELGGSFELSPAAPPPSARSDEVAAAERAP